MLDSAEADQLLLRRALRSLREEADLKQRELATRLGRDQAFVSRYETGKRELTFVEVREICQVLGRTFDWFVWHFEAKRKREREPDYYRWVSIPS